MYKVTVSLLLLIALCLCGCSHTKTIFIVNYRPVNYSVETSESNGQSDGLPAKTGVALSCDEYVAGPLILYLTNSKGIRETITVDPDKLKRNTVKDTVVIVEIK